MNIWVIISKLSIVIIFTLMSPFIIVAYFAMLLSSFSRKLENAIFSINDSISDYLCKLLRIDYINEKVRERNDRRNPD